MILQKIKKSILVLSMLGMVFVPVLAPAIAHADAISTGLTCGTELNPGAVTGNTAGTGCTSPGGDPGQKLNGIVTLVINIFSLVVGIVSVIMIIVGGLKYITSGGDSGNITGAKNTILYAIIGLVIVALAQFIVRFVLSKVGSTVGG